MAVMAKPKPKPEPPVTWAAKLKLLRDRWGADGKPLTQALAAERLGVTPRSWIGWETYGREPAAPVCKLIDLLLANPSLDLK